MTSAYLTLWYSASTQFLVIFNLFWCFPHAVDRRNWSCYWIHRFWSCCDCSFMEMCHTTMVPEWLQVQDHNDRWSKSRGIFRPWHRVRLRIERIVSCLRWHPALLKPLSDIWILHKSSYIPGLTDDIEIFVKLSRSTPIRDALLSQNSVLRVISVTTALTKSGRFSPETSSDVSNCFLVYCSYHY